MWIKREIEDILAADREFVQLLIGPRQCGKSSLFSQMDPSFEEFSMDDLSTRELAQKDPELFLSQAAGKKMLIDEAQLAPNLFHAVKRVVDLWKRQKRPKETMFRLTGSNQILFDHTVKESLAGRARYFELNTLSISEICRSLDFSVHQILYNGGWPELYSYAASTDTVPYLDSYLRSYLEKDIVLAAGIQKQLEFLMTCKILAGRTGQILNMSEISKEVGVEVSTLRDWISVLERMKMIALVEPYFSNSSKRLVKSPKVYFIDTGIACRLQGWTRPDGMLTSPQFGPLFETLVFSEIYKMIHYNQLSWKIYHWRTRDGEEIDFLIDMGNTQFAFVEVKVTTQDPPDLVTYPEVCKVFKAKLPPIWLCHMHGERVTGRRVPIKYLRDTLLAAENAAS